MIASHTVGVAIALLVIASGCNRSPSDGATAALAPAAATPRPVTTGPATHEAAPRLAADDAAASRPANAQLAQTNANMIDALKPSIEGHVTLDGDVVSGVQQADACHTTFTTSNGPTIIAWSQVGNVITHLVNGRQETSLKTNGQSHVLSVPVAGYADADANGIRGALDQLAGECGAY